MKRALPVFLLLFVFTLFGCASQGKAEEQVTIKFGTLWILDAVPVHVADQEGLFKAHNLNVEIIPFNSAVERDTAFEAGQIDAELNDLLSAAVLNRDAQKARVVRTAMRTTPDSAMFSILAGPKSSISGVDGLKNTDIAISTKTVIEYVADQLLDGAGLKRTEIRKLEVTNMPLRLQMLLEGQVPAALLPEPLASAAKSRGAKVILDDRGKTVGQSVVSFSQKMVQEKPESIGRFLLAYEEAVAALEKEPEKYRELMVKVGRVPQEISRSLPVPVYPKAAVPSKAEIEAVGQWLVEKQQLNKPLPYDKVVTAQFLPKG